MAVLEALASFFHMPKFGFVPGDFGIRGIQGRLSGIESITGSVNAEPGSCSETGPLSVTVIAM